MPALTPSRNSLFDQVLTPFVKYDLLAKHALSDDKCNYHISAHTINEIIILTK